jgi:toxin CptA
MNNAPAVSYPVGRSRFQVGLLALAVLGGALAGLLWLLAPGVVGWRQWLMAVSVLCAGVSAFEVWRRTANGVLRWDGHGWCCTPAVEPMCGDLTVHVDLQSQLVLSLRTDRGRRVWLWPERRSDAVHWNALRQAVFSGHVASQRLGSGGDTERKQAQK